MTPGRYLARAIVSRDGVTVKTLTRPITIVRDPTVVVESALSRGDDASASCADLAGAAVPHSRVRRWRRQRAGERRRRRKTFTLSKPDRRVTSDLLLVRYPGSQRDLISYRDVIQLNGKPVPGREQRLIDLFVTPPAACVQQARQIMAERRPVRAVGVQPDASRSDSCSPTFQSRFELTVNDAGPAWPREVKAITFVEIASADAAANVARSATSTCRRAARHGLRRAPDAFCRPN